MSVTVRHNFRIVHLIDAPEAAPTLAKWFIEEWTPWFGPDGQGDAESDLEACRSREELPICLVALNGDGEVLGTAALKSDSVGGELGVGPWLAAMLVGTDHRGGGIGAALVEAIEEEARRLGFSSIYTSTEPAESIPGRRGWQAFGDSESLKGPVTVYRLQIREGDIDEGGMTRSW